MRVAAALSNSLVIGLLAVFAMGKVASADILEVEPDAFPEGTVLNDKFPGVTLSNETLRGDPDETDVLVRDGTLTGGGPRNGKNVASTGDLVFGRESAPDNPENLIIWSGVPGVPTEISAVLRADFDPPAKSVSIDVVPTDDDTFELRAFRASDVGPDIELLPFDTVDFPPGSVPPFPDPPPTLSITRAVAEIDYIYAYGVPPEGAGVLDNLRVEFLTLPVFIDIKPKDDQNRINICAKGNLPVAILSYANFSGGTYFDATEVDPLTVDLGGAGVRRIGKDGERALHKIEDVNGDGLPDMVVMIVQEDLSGLDSDTTELTLTGQRSDSTPFVGTDAIDVTQFMCVRSVE